MKFTRKKLVLLIIAILILVSAAYVYLNKSKQPVASARVAVKVARGNITVSVAGSGPISATREQALKAPTDSTIKEILVKDGDAVTAGQTLIVFDSPGLMAMAAELKVLENQVANLNYHAPFAARVTSVKVKEGQMVTKGTSILTLVDTRQVTLNIPQGQDISELVSGAKVELDLLEYGEKLVGRITGAASGFSSNGKNLYSLPMELETDSTLSGNTLVTITTAKGSQFSGQLQPNPGVDVKAPDDGTVTSISVQQGDSISAGAPVITVDSPTLIAQYYNKLANYQATIGPGGIVASGADYALTTAFSGTYVGAVDSTGPKNTFLQPGDVVKANQSLGKILAPESLQISFTVDELDIAKVELGQKARVTTGALPGKTFDATVVRAAKEGIVQNGVAFYWVTVELKGGEGLLLGMTADVEIVVAEKNDTLIMPIGAIQDLRGKKFVVLNDGTNKTNKTNKTSKAASNPAQNGGQLPDNAVMVEIGLHNENQVEIVKGLVEGQEVLLPEVKRALNSTAGNNQGNGSQQPQRVQIPGGLH